MTLKRKFVILMLVLIMFCSMFTGCGKSVANVWLVDSTAPTSKTKGNNGDMYLNTSNYDLYQMQDGKWLKLGNIAGKDGVTPTIEISEDGYWVINGKKTTTRAEGRDGKDGKDGKDGISPLISISEDGYWVINGVKTAVKAKAQDGTNGKDGADGANGKDGKDGLTPTIEFSEDGYWIINGIKTKIKAKGEDGKTPTIAISEDGYWVINGVKTKIKAECKNCITQYQEAENIEVPDLYNYTLTPVVYDGSNWKVADIRKKWYSYANQEWANAVLLADGVTKNTGDTVKVDGTEALAMYVWIPRYEYKIEGQYGKGGTIESPGEIDINFIPDYQTKSSSGYMIHPAFTFGDTKLTGMWVAKFEISHTSKTTESMNCIADSCAQGNNIRILPNKQTLRSNTVSSFFYGIKSMEKSGNVFGIDSSVTDSHMIKNSEWAAVAYLSQSKYGKYGNDDYSGLDKRIYINNSSSFYTGKSGGTSGTNVSATSNGTYSYNIEKSGTGASTTGNITGIYDMAGGTWEYVMGVFANSNGEAWSGNSVTANSGFKGKTGTNGAYYNGREWPNVKYYDAYKATDGISISPSTACNGGECYGHDLEETKKWYNGYYYFVSASEPWFVRGGSSVNGNNTNLFLASTAYGRATEYTTRSVLVGSSKQKTTKTYTNGEVVYYDVTTGKKCTNYNLENSKTGYNGIDNKTENQNSCLKFYAFNDEGSSTINLILDHNTTATVAWNLNNDNSAGPKETLEQLKSDTKNWKGTIEPSNYKTGISGREYTINYSGYTSRLLTANEVAKISKNTKWDENASTGDISFFFDTAKDEKSAYCNENSIIGCKYGWLYDRTSNTCATEGCLNNSEVSKSGYWTASATPQLSTGGHSSCNYRVTYGISSHGRLGYTCPNNETHYGIRPVIEVSKSNL